MKKLWLIVSIVILSACSDDRPSHQQESSSPKQDAPQIQLPDGVTLIESKLEDRNEPHIPYAKYQLDNGLTVILSPDDSDPLVHVDVTYHVGSAREQRGHSGFAHFFEHMMFQGSEHVADEEHFRIVTEAGGTLNGTTNRDRTNYYQTLPSNQLEKALWLESDRMGFLINAVTQEKFEIQRDTVKNERAQNYDNRPYGLIWERISEALYPEGHPYSWQTIGYVSDLDAVNVNDLKAFFLRWYGPNNAVVTIGGDIDQAQTLKWVNKYFGSIPQGPEVENAPKQPAKLDADRFITLEDRIRQPMVVMGFPAEYRGADSQVKLTAVADILTKGVLFNELVRTGKALEATAFLDCAELSCVFYIYALGNAEDDLTAVYASVMDALALAKEQGIDQTELDAIIGQAESSAVFGIQSVSGKVSELAHNQTFFGQPDRLNHYLQDYRALTTQELDQAFERFINNKAKVVLSVVPKKATELAVQAPNFTPPQRVFPDYKEISDEELQARQPQDEFDRNQIPEASGAVTVKIPELYRFDLDNGIPVLGTKTQETPTTTIAIKFPAGSLQVPKGKEGLSKLLVEMLMEDTKNHSTDELDRKLDTLGSSVNVYEDEDSLMMVISSLSKNLNETLALANERLFEPAFFEEDFERVKNQAIQDIYYAHQTPTWMANQATNQLLFAGTKLALDSEGTESSLENISLNDVKEFYKKHIVAQGTQVLVVGDVSEKEIKTALTKLSQQQGSAPQKALIGEIKPLQGQAIYLVDKANAPQSIVRLVRLAKPYDATGEMFLTRLANFNLGGNFNSRINQNLREDKGYTYGARGDILGAKDYGYIIFSAQVRADATGDSIQEFINEMAQYQQKGMTKQELEFMRLAMGQQDALSYETPSQKIDLLDHLNTFSLEDDFMHKQADIIQTATQQALNNAAKTWFDPKDYQIIVVGDAQTVLPQLEALKIPIKQIELMN